MPWRCWSFSVFFAGRSCGSLFQNYYLFFSSFLHSSLFPCDSVNFLFPLSTWAFPLGMAHQLLPNLTYKLDSWQLAFLHGNVYESSHQDSEPRLRPSFGTSNVSSCKPICTRYEESKPSLRFAFWASGGSYCKPTAVSLVFGKHLHTTLTYLLISSLTWPPCRIFTFPSRNSSSEYLKHLVSMMGLQLPCGSSSGLRGAL